MRLRRLEWSVARLALYRRSLLRTLGDVLSESCANTMHGKSQKRDEVMRCKSANMMQKSELFYIKDFLDFIQFRSLPLNADERYIMRDRYLAGHTFSSSPKRLYLLERLPGPLFSVPDGCLSPEGWKRDCSQMRTHPAWCSSESRRPCHVAGRRRELSLFCSTLAIKAICPRFPFSLSLYSWLAASARRPDAVLALRIRSK
jgi:hypothetical protein